MYENYKVCAKSSVKEKEKTQVRKRVAIAYRNHRGIAIHTQQGLNLKDGWSKRVSDNVPELTPHQVGYIFAEWNLRRSKPSFISLPLSRPLYGQVHGVEQNLKVMSSIMAMMNSVDVLTRTYGFFDIFMGDIYTRTFQENAVSNSEVIACEYENSIIYFAHVKLKNPSFSMIRDLKKRESYKKKWAKLPSKTWLFTWSTSKDSELGTRTTYKTIDLTSAMKKFGLFAL